MTPFNGPFWPVDFGKLRAKICESLPAARPAFSVGHFDPLILLRVESGCPLGNLIFNDLEALQVELSGHFDHLIFTSGSERLGVTVKWYFPKWEAPLYRIEAAFTLRWR